MVDRTVPPGFDPDSSDWSQGDEPSTDSIASELGFTKWADVIRPDAEIDRTGVRPGQYLTPQEAMRHAFDMPFGSFPGTWFLVYDGEDDVWYIEVDY